jgi:LuxR family maltose regulon positive regulatory protein
MSLWALVEARRRWTTGLWVRGGTGEPVEDPVGHQVGLVVLANAALARGEPGPAAEAAAAATDRAISDGNGYTTARGLTILGMAVGMGGDITRMMELAEQAERCAPADRWRSTEGAALNAVVRAYGTLLQARPQESRRLARGVLGIGTGASGEPAGPGMDGLLPVAEMLLAAARFDLGGGPRVLDAMRSVRSALSAGAALRRPAAIGALLGHDAAMWLRRADHAREILGWAEERLGPTGDVLFLRAAALGAAGRYDVAREHLQPVLDGSPAPVVHWTLVGAWLLECDIALARGAAARAREALRRALAVADELGVLRPLVYAPPRVAGFLSEQVGGLGAGDRRARDVLAVGWARERVPPLTPREIAVLTLLPTQLSLEDIAGDLGVSINTVKSHVRAVYGKLGVDSRRSAVGAARTSGLIESEAAP